MRIVKQIKSQHIKNRLLEVWREGSPVGGDSSVASLCFIKSEQKESQPGIQSMESYFSAGQKLLDKNIILLILCDI